MIGSRDERDGKTALAEVLSLLDLEQIEEDIFRGLSPKAASQRVFGGQVLGQALAAAIAHGRTVTHLSFSARLFPAPRRSPSADPL